MDLQGPAESRWGYTAPTMVDWNSDGLMDLISSDNSARTLLYLRQRVPSQPRLCSDDNATNAGQKECAALIREAQAAKSSVSTVADHKHATAKTKTRQRDESDDQEVSPNKRSRMTTTFRGIPSVETMRLREVEDLEVQFHRYCKEAGLRGTLRVLALRFCMVRKHRMC